MNREILLVLVTIFILFLITLIIIVIRHKNDKSSISIPLTTQIDYSPNSWKKSKIDDVKKTIYDILIDFKPTLPKTLIEYISTCTSKKFSNTFHWARVNEILQNMKYGKEMDLEMFEVYINCLNSESDILIKAISNEKNTAMFNQCMSHLPVDIKRTFTNPLTHCILKHTS